MHTGPHPLTHKGYKVKHDNWQDGSTYDLMAQKDDCHFRFHILAKEFVCLVGQRSWLSKWVLLLYVYYFSSAHCNTMTFNPYKLWQDMIMLTVYVGGKSSFGLKINTMNRFKFIQLKGIDNIEENSGKTCKIAIKCEFSQPQP